jgi:hypothetical protein
MGKIWKEEKRGNYEMRGVIEKAAAMQGFREMNRKGQF